MKALQRFLEGMNRLKGKSISLDEVGYELRKGKWMKHSSLEPS